MQFLISLADSQGWFLHVLIKMKLLCNIKRWRSKFKHPPTFWASATNYKLVFTTETSAFGGCEQSNSDAPAATHTPFRSGFPTHPTCQTVTPSWLWSNPKANYKYGYSLLDVYQCTFLDRKCWTWCVYVFISRHLIWGHALWQMHYGMYLCNIMSSCVFDQSWPPVHVSRISGQSSSWIFKATSCTATCVTVTLGFCLLTKFECKALSHPLL